MTPGRFVSYWFLYVGTLMLFGLLLDVATGEHQIRRSLYTASTFLPAVAALFIGFVRFRNPAQEEWPEAYGPWTYVALLFLLVMTAWLLFVSLF